MASRPPEGHEPEVSPAALARLISPAGHVNIEPLTFARMLANYAPS